MGRFFKSFIITVAVLTTIVTVKTAADYICRRYRKTYIKV